MPSLIVYRREVMKCIRKRIGGNPRFGIDDAALQRCIDKHYAPDAIADYFLDAMWDTARVQAGLPSVFGLECLAWSGVK